MDLAVKIVVLLLLLVEVFGRSIRLEDGSDNATEISNIILPDEGAACEFNGVSHSLDSKFSVPDDPCLVCECDENWTGSISNSSCYKEECESMQDNSKLTEGCIPVYDETKCCVIDFYCRDDNVISNSAEDTEIENDDTAQENDEVVCPTPICADESCRIETPPGHLCPTCICEGVREKNEFESSEQLSERHPLETENATGDMEFFLIPVPWSGVSDRSLPQENGAAEDESSYGEGAEISKSETLQIGNEDQEPREMNYADSSLNAIPGEMNSREAGPRRKRAIQTATTSSSHQHLQQQQRWTVLEEDQLTQQFSDDSDGREHEDLVDGSDDYGEMKIYTKKESATADNEITDLYDEESIVWDKIVPGCPSPLCEHSGCRIGILPRHRCPTCICNRMIRQP